MLQLCFFGSVRSPTVLCILFCRQCSVYDPCRHVYVNKSLPLKQPKAQNLLKHSGETHFAGNGCWHRLCHCSECCGDWHRNWYASSYGDLGSCRNSALVIFLNWRNLLLTIWDYWGGHWTKHREAGDDSSFMWEALSRDPPNIPS